VAVTRASDQPARTIVGLGEKASVVEGAGHLGRRRGDVKSKRADNDWYQDQPDPHVLLVLGRLLWQGEPS
jgi:hypothetical protein